MQDRCVHLVFVSTDWGMCTLHSVAHHTIWSLGRFVMLACKSCMRAVHCMVQLTHMLCMSIYLWSEPHILVEIHQWWVSTCGFPRCSLWLPHPTHSIKETSVCIYDSFGTTHTPIFGNSCTCDSCVARVGSHVAACGFHNKSMNFMCNDSQRTENTDSSNLFDCIKFIICLAVV